MIEEDRGLGTEIFGVLPSSRMSMHMRPSWLEAEALWGRGARTLQEYVLVKLMACWSSGRMRQLLSEDARGEGTPSRIRRRRGLGCGVILLAAPSSAFRRRFLQSFGGVASVAWMLRQNHRPSMLAKSQLRGACSLVCRVTTASSLPQGL